MKKRLLLVSPRRALAAYDDLQPCIQSVLCKRESLLTAGLATIAALTPPQFTVRIIDEYITPVAFDTPCDLVGLAGFPYQLARAEQIAAGFSRQGKLVVCGGSSVTLSPEKWRPFADVLIIGEAERIWKRFLDDYLEGSYCREYREEERPDLAETPVPDYSGYSPRSLRKYLAAVVQTSRGCPYDCEFCDAVVYMGHKPRYKPVAHVLEEVAQIGRMPGMRYILMADDNFSAHAGKAKEILAALGQWNRQQRVPLSFHTQLSVDIAGDDEFLRLAAEAGLTSVFAGIETPDLSSLAECRKTPNLRIDLLQAVQRFHAYGIQVVSNSIVGFDHDDSSVFQKQFDFSMRSGIAMVRVSPLQVLDGTPLKERMIREGRYLPSLPDSASELFHFSFIPRQLSHSELQQGICWLLRQLYMPENFLIRFETFFSHFAASPCKAGLAIPPSHIGLQELAVSGRLAWQLLVHCSAEEKALFRRMAECAERSRHPRRFAILLEDFAQYLNMRQLLVRILPAGNGD